MMIHTACEPGSSSFVRNRRRRFHGGGFSPECFWQWFYDATKKGRSEMDDMTRKGRSEMARTKAAAADVIKITSAKRKQKPVSPAERSVVIKPPQFEVATIKIRGIAPYVQHKFSQKSREKMIASQKLGQQSRKGTAKEPKDFDAAYEAAMHKSRDGWHGIPCSAFRNAAISACRIVGFKMTIAKLSLFVEADGFDTDGEPLVRITKGQPRQHFAQASNSNGGTDIRCRPMWAEGWEASVRVRWDAEQFSASDVVNLFARVGLQVGVGEGLPPARISAGLGWGVFEVIN